MATTHPVIEQVFSIRPSLRTQVVGVSGLEIDELERLAGVALPSGYRAYLELMGRDPGPFKALYTEQLVYETGQSPREWVGEVEIRFDPVLSRHRRRRKRSTLNDQKNIAERFLFFGINPIGDDNGDFFLDLRDPVRLPVVERTETRGDIPRSNSFFSLLFARDFGRVVRKWLADLEPQTFS